METQKHFIWYGLENCARCGKHHSALEFSRFGIPIVLGNDDEYKFNYWGTCPETKEPILMRVIEE